MDSDAATVVPCSHGEGFFSDQGPENVNPPEPKCFVTHDKPHDNRFIIPEPISSRTRRKLQLGKCDDNQITSNLEMDNEMEPSSEDEEGEVNATCCRSQAHAVYHGTSGVVSKEITMPGSGQRVTILQYNTDHPGFLLVSYQCNYILLDIPGRSWRTQVRPKARTTLDRSFYICLISLVSEICAIP